MLQLHLENCLLTNYEQNEIMQRVESGVEVILPGLQDNILFSGAPDLIVTFVSALYINNRQKQFCK